MLITVYRNSKGQYKLEPGPTPVYFLAFAAMIPLGLIGCVVLSKNIIKYHREEKRVIQKRRKRTEGGWI